MSAHRAEFLDWIPAYAAGALDGDELASLERHLEMGCEACDAAISEWSRVTEELAVSENTPVEPSASARRQLFAAVEERVSGRPETTPVRSIWSKFLPATLAASWLLLAWSGWNQLQLRSELADLTAERREATAELRRVRSELQQTRAALDQTVLASRVVSAPLVHSVRLAGLEAAPEASARTYLDPSTGRAVFYASTLERLPTDRTYQLWFIADGAPVSAGVFEVDPEGSASLVVEDVAPVETIQAWAVTVEPAGGVEQPTGAMVLKS